jgi:hypothetical protein
VTNQKERGGALPPHRTRRISLTKTQLRTELGAELLSLCESVTADGTVTPDEAQALRQWLDDSQGIDLPAASYMREVVARAIADGQITREECREVYRAVEAVLPPEVRRTAVANRRGVEAAKKAQARAAREQERLERQRNAPIASANFMVAGCRYEGRPGIIARHANAGDPVRLSRDVGNRFSTHAIGVQLEGGQQIGFVPEEIATELAPELDAGARCAAYMTKILTGGRSPIPVVQARLYAADSTIDVDELAGRLRHSREQGSTSAQPPRSRVLPGQSWRVWLAIAVAVVVLAGVAMLL